MQNKDGLAIFALIAAIAAIAVEVVGFAWPYLAHLDDPAGFMRRANMVALGFAALGTVLGFVTRYTTAGRRALWLGIIMLAVTLGLSSLTYASAISGSPS